MRFGAAEIGDLILWGDPEDPAMIVYEVGPYYRLQRVVDGLTWLEWVERDNATWATAEDGLRRRADKGEIAKTAYQARLARVGAGLMDTEQWFFGDGDATVELDESARSFSQRSGGGNDQ